MEHVAKISARRVEVFRGRLRVVVALSPKAPRHAAEALVAAAYEAYPTLPLHSCINSKGPTFGDVAVGTSVPHLLEHLVIAEQVRIAVAHAGAGARADAGAGAGAGASAGATAGAGAGAGRGEAFEDVTFVGTTQWCAGGPDGGEAVVEVSFVDDLQAIEALVRALAFLNANL